MCVCVCMCGGRGGGGVGGGGRGEGEEREMEDKEKKKKWRKSSTSCIYSNSSKTPSYSRREGNGHPLISPLKELHPCPVLRPAAFSLFFNTEKKNKTKNNPQEEFSLRRRTTGKKLHCSL